MAVKVGTIKINEFHLTLSASMLLITTPYFIWLFLILFSTIKAHSSFLASISVSANIDCDYKSINRFADSYQENLKMVSNFFSPIYFEIAIILNFAILDFTSAKWSITAAELEFLISPILLVHDTDTRATDHLW